MLTPGLVILVPVPHQIGEYPGYGVYGHTCHGVYGVYGYHQLGGDG